VTGMAPNDWLALAESDLAAAQAMLARAQRLYLQMGLQCHEAVGKALTASYLKQHGVRPPETADLVKLLADLPGRADLDARLLQTVEWLNTYPLLAARDAGDLGDLAALLTEDKTKELLDRTKELVEWIKANL